MTNAITNSFAPLRWRPRGSSARLDRWVLLAGNRSPEVDQASTNCPGPCPDVSGPLVQAPAELEAAWVVAP